jgi:PHD/YefM family antitoxin component YafN of YafNO toxin-antitoxin module
MAVAYRKEEILSASRVARSFGKVLTDLKAQHRRRVVVLKNNQVEAVIVSVDDYEKMAEAFDLLEHMEIHRLVTQRARKKGKKPLASIPRGRVMRQARRYSPARFKTRRQPSFLSALLAGGCTSICMDWLHNVSESCNYRLHDFKSFLAKDHLTFGLSAEHVSDRKLTLICPSRISGSQLSEPKHSYT